MRDWKGLLKSIEENSELITELGNLNKELLKLNSYPDGNHPRRTKNVILKVEEEVADTLAALEYFVARNGLNDGKIQRRKAYKVRKFEKRWGAIPKKNGKKQSKKRTSK